MDYIQTEVFSSLLLTKGAWENAEGSRDGVRNAAVSQEPKVFQLSREISETTVKCLLYRHFIQLH